jgi:hypothetical protein
MRFLLVFVAMTVTVAVPVTTYGRDLTGWNFEKSVDSFADRAVFDTMKYGPNKDSGLVIYCNPHYDPATRESHPEFGSYIHVHLITPLKTSGHDPDFEIQYRLDDGPAVKSIVDYEDGVFAFLEPTSARIFFLQLTRANRVRFRVYGDSKNVYTDYDFNLDGVRATAKQLIDECEAYP